jgi:hypothetical protein
VQVHTRFDGQLVFEKELVEGMIVDAIIRRRRRRVGSNDGGAIDAWCIKLPQPPFSSAKI